MAVSMDKRNIFKLWMERTIDKDCNSLRCYQFLFKLFQPNVDCVFARLMGNLMINLLLRAF